MTPKTQPRIVLILGSAPDAVLCRDWIKSTDLSIVAINNAWRVRDDWDYLISPDDFPAEKGPDSVLSHQMRVTSDDYVPANNAYGGVLYAGGTMAFTAGYWALAALRPQVMAFLGCDMIYANASKTHFYGEGQPDPLRKDPSLRSLEAKSARLMGHAARQGCACVRLSHAESRLVFPSARYDDLHDLLPANAAANSLGDAQGAAFDAAKAQEDRLGYVEPSGRYWEVEDRFDLAEIDALDRLWLNMAAR